MIWKARTAACVFGAEDAVVAADRIAQANQLSLQLGHVVSAHIGLARRIPKGALLAEKREWIRRFRQLDRGVIDTRQLTGNLPVTELRINLDTAAARPAGAMSDLQGADA